MGLRITTWNVNGIRNPFSYQPWRDKKSFASMFDVLEADIVVLQETKIQRKDLKDDMVLVPGWDCYFSLPKYEKGKFGVVIYTRQSVCAPIKAEEGLTGILCPPSSTTSFKDLPEEQQIGGYPSSQQALSCPQITDLATDFANLDSEGRCVILEFPAFVLLGVYNPATRDESRTSFRIAFLNLLDIRIRNLVSMGKRVILTGDLNIIKTEMDRANCDVDLRKSGTSVEEYFSTPPRRLLNHLVDDGTVWGDRDEGRETPVLHDLCRAFHPTRKGMFTCWETRINARPGNYGSRIDYVMCSLDMKDWFADANIQEGLMGSDHCPVYVVTKDSVVISGKDTNILDVMNPPGVYRNGERLREYSNKDMLPLSGKLIPEFNGRRSIKDMFSKQHVSFTALPSQKTHILDQIPAGTTGERHSKRIRDSAYERVISLSNSPTQLVTAKRPPIEVLPGKGSKRAKPRIQTQAEALTSEKSQRSLTAFLSGRAKHRASTKEVNDDDLHSFTSSDVFVATAEHMSSKALSPSPSITSAPKSITAASPNEKSLEIHENRTPPERDLSILSNRAVIDQVQSKESWSKLFTKPAAPLCEGHSESCKIMTTKKPGSNCGRSFWMCARPLGPSGQKEKGTQWRCGE